MQCRARPREVETRAAPHKIPRKESASVLSCTAHQVPPRPHVVPAQLGFTKSRTQTLAPRRAASLPHARPPEPPPITTRLQGRARRLRILPAYPKLIRLRHSLKVKPSTVPSHKGVAIENDSRGSADGATTHVRRANPLEGLIASPEKIFPVEPNDG